MSWGLDNATVRYGDATALDKVSVALAPGKVTSVVGGDGAGKSTVCRSLVGLARLESGLVKRPPTIGFQPSSSGTWRDLTVLENLQLVALAHRIGPTPTTERIDRLLAATNLSSAADRLAAQLSGGMRQKLGVAMALLPEPELIVLDEPTTGVDPVSRLEIWAFIMSAARTGCGVLVTTTYLEEAARTNHVVALEAGTTLASGTPQDVIHAMPGAIFRSDTGAGPNSWRRGRKWRIWSPDGSRPDGAEPATPDLEDVVTVAALISGGEQ